ncbi:MAG: RNA 2',3'-cyclic phosphodiesterase, partial [Elusimicrobia bacterium]|nr:RNA 2',3'-cyclic phosphodiesterase [Elusimicrobiota bacterium]
MGARVFLATKPPPCFINEVSKMSEYLKKELGIGIKWIKPENLHITYVFLGDVPLAKSYAIIEAMQEIKTKSFSVSAGKLGCFSLTGKPRIIWLGVNEGFLKLEEIAEKLRFDLESKGFIFKNKFFP